MYKSAAPLWGAKRAKLISRNLQAPKPQPSPPLPTSRLQKYGANDLRASATDVFRFKVFFPSLQSSKFRLPPKRAKIFQQKKEVSF